MAQSIKLNWRNKPVWIMVWRCMAAISMLPPLPPSIDGHTLLANDPILESQQ
jgi:hypothetical protein